MRGKTINWWKLFSNCVTVHSTWTYIFVVFFSPLSYGYTPVAGHCDWSGSGLEGHGGNVIPIYLKCSQGEIEWLYPSGGLRIVLQSGSKMPEFRGCLKVNSEFSGARIYVENFSKPRSLKLLYNHDDGRPSALVRCFDSHKGQAVLYVESDENNSKLNRTVASFQYDLQTINYIHASEKKSECRPCSDAELLKEYCTSDFVVRGSIVSVYNNYPLERTELTIRAIKVVRQTTRVFEESKERYFKVKYPSKYLSKIYGVIHLPLSCEAKHDSGQFLFMGKMRLGEPVIQCAPKFYSWLKLKKKANREGISQCS